ncbi:MAG: hypothetical protein ACYDEA_08665 [Candidatus Dormibacteria bacterium]
MSRLSAADFYSTADEAPAQGDILLAAVSRIVADDMFTPPRWRVLDQISDELAPPHGPLPALRVAAGRSLVMVTTHDCGLDKEFNAVVDRLLNAPGPGADKDVATERAQTDAEADPQLDRTFQASPLLDPSTVEVAGVPVDQGLLQAGRIVGYLPVPALVVDGATLIPEAVVDLNYRATLDRLAYPQRVTAVSEVARGQLRHALARLDVLRTPTLEAGLSAAVGQELRSARVDKANPLQVVLTLADGTTLELWQRPGSPPDGPVSRSRRSVR